MPPKNRRGRRAPLGVMTMHVMLYIMLYIMLCIMLYIMLENAPPAKIVALSGGVGTFTCVYPPRHAAPPVRYLPVSCYLFTRVFVYVLNLFIQMREDQNGVT